MYVLTNGLVTFTFNDDGTSGLKLSSFKRDASSQTWANAETVLWRAKVYDTTTAPATATVTFTPTLATLASLITTATTLVATWTAVPVGGGDLLNVVVSCETRAGEDWLRTRITSSWNGTPTTRSLHSLSCLPVKIDPLNAGADYAVMPAVFGILSKNPITNLRYNPVPPFAVTGFGLLTNNTWTYPAGRGWSMGFWGYYETTSSQGWMVWVEDWSLEPFKATFESDATRMVFEEYQDQEDNVLVANNGRTLGSGYTFCLRPLQVTQANGWWDIGAHYKARVEAGQPSFYTKARNARTDISTIERDYSLFLDLQAIDTTHVPSDGMPGDIAGMFNAARTGSGVAPATPISGIVDAPTYNLIDVGEVPNGDLQAKLQSLYDNDNTYLSFWMPQALNQPGPDVWDIARCDQNLGDSAELRWWTNNDGLGSMWMSRKGYLEGGGNDRLATVDATHYYRERNYPIVSWVDATNTLTVTGTPSADGFPASNVTAVLIPASGSARLASAAVASLGAATIVTVTDFTDHLGTVVTPTAADTVELRTLVGGPYYCPDALNHSAAYLNRLMNNTAVGTQDAFGACGYYFDLYSEPFIQSQAADRTPCYRDHGTWSKIDGGYVRHPYGGGSWHKLALRSFVNEFKVRARAAQVADGREPFFWQSCEDIDETMHDRFDWCWHNVSSGSLWRYMDGAYNQANNNDSYKTIPLYAVVYPGRTMGRALNQEFSSATLSAPYSTDAVLHAFLAYCLASEWPYGLTWPTLSFFVSDTVTLKNFYDDTLYISGGGTVSNTVKQIRDLWAQIVRAESGWLIDEGFRYGTMMAPAVLNYASTATTTGLADTTYATDLYNNYDTIYERATFPRVTHGVWKSSTGSVCIVLVNWTDTAGGWSGYLNLESLGLGAPGSEQASGIVVSRFNADGSLNGTAALNTLNGELTLGSVPAFTVAVVTLVAAESSIAGGGMKRLDMKNYVANFLQVSPTFTNENWTALEVEQYLRDHELTIATMVAEKFENFFCTSASLSEVASVSIISLPTNCFRVLKVERIAGGGATTLTPIPLTKIQSNVTDESLARGGRLFESQYLGTQAFPMYYAQHGQKQIELFPTPAGTTANALRVTYIYRPAMMTSDTHSPFQETAGVGGAGKDNLEEFHDILPKYAIEMCLIKEEAYQQADRIRNERMLRESQLVTFLSRMNVQEPKFVRYTDSDAW